MALLRRRSSLADVVFLVAAFASLAVLCVGLSAEVRSVQLWLCLFGLAAGVTLAVRALLQRSLAPLAELGLLLARRRESRTPFLGNAERYAPFSEAASVALELSSREREAAAQVSAVDAAAGGDRATFLRSVSHELRTPLNAILGFADVLQNELDGPINADQRENLGIIRSSADKLARVVNDMIDVAQLSATDVLRPRTSFEVAELLEAVRETLEERRGLRLVYVRVTLGEGVERITAEREGLARALRILAEYALESTDSGEVALSCERTAQGHRLCVRGDGMEREAVELSALLDEAVHAHKKPRATLLRLAIARELVLLQGGWIELSAAGEERPGALIAVNLPLEPLQPSAAGTETPT